MNPSGQLSIEALHTGTLYIYIGTLDRLADSHTMLAIYPAHAICY